MNITFSISFYCRQSKQNAKGYAPIVVRVTIQKEEFFNNEWKRMYVAATRAKRSLILTHASTIRRKGYSFKKEGSRFIANL